MIKKIFLTLLFILSANLAFAQADSIEICTNDSNSSLYPESMGYDLDSLLSEWNAMRYLIRDTTCTNPDFNPTVSDSVMMLRLRRLPTIMEMVYNDVVREYIDQYTGRMRRSISYMLGASNFYMPIFEEALDCYGLPLELRYLPIIESALNPKARSRAGAVGLWQFMMTTARQYGLKVNSLVDERQDPVKSSYAAARFLKDLYNIYNDWNLVIAAYNCGPGNVNKAIHRAGEVRDYWAIYNYLPRETRGYVPAFIAANYAMNYYCEHNICPMKMKDHPMDTDTIMLSRDVHIAQIEAITGAGAEMIKALNPQYRTNIIPGTSELTSLRLPLEHLATFISQGDSVYNYNAELFLTKRTRVDIPKENAKSKSTSKAKYVTVRKGNTLGLIAKHNGTTVAKIKKLNGLKNNNIRAGQRLRVR